FTTPASPNVVAGDFNSDGISDLVSIHYSSSTGTVRLGAKGKNFGETFDFSTGAGPNHAAVADLDRNGSLDLVVSNNLTPTVTVHLGSGDGRFGSRTDVGLGVAANAQSVAVQDVNGDGIPDIAVAALAANKVVLLIGQGNGTFTPGASVGSGEKPLFLASTDF